MIKKILVISDTHDNLNALDKLTLAIDKSDIDMIIHCGDIVSPFTLTKLIRFVTENVEILTVLGNNEGEVFKIVEDYKEMKRENFKLEKMSLETNINGYKAFIIHGWGNSNNFRKIVHNISKGGDYKILLYGHTHIPELTIIRYGGDTLTKLFGTLDKDIEWVAPLDEIKTVIINPGELSGWLSNEQTYALLEFIENKKLKISIKKLTP